MHGVNLELRGLKKALDKLIEKKSFLLDELTITYASGKQFDLQQEIKTLDTQIEDLRQKINQLGMGIGNPGITVYTQRLPDTNARLFGRDKELQLLYDFWNDPSCNIVEFIAWGGVGKTALISYWLTGMAAEGYRGAQRVYAWSFYSQGAGDHRQSTADPFIIDMLKWHGKDPLQIPMDPIERARMLVKEIRTQRCLLILDGLEPLQYPPGEMEGKLKDLGLRALLKELANWNPGLCLISSRIKVSDLDGFVGRTVRHMPLEGLTPQAAAQLLGYLKVKGKPLELEAVSIEFNGHALALRLLGNYRNTFHQGDLRKRDRIKKLTMEEKHGGHARRVIDTYVQWFKQDEKFLPELIVLYLVGLFDRPSPAGALAALLDDPALDSITALFKKLSPEGQTLCLKHLQNQDLLRLTYSPNAQLTSQPINQFTALNSISTIDAHPLIREFFAEKFHTDYPNIWRKAHATLYEYFKGLPEKHLPETLEEMEPLFQAVAHGCKAGLEQRAYQEVYENRIQRGNEYFSLKKLGGWGTELIALSYFFTRCWKQPSMKLQEENRAEVLSTVGYILRSMGRLEEATQPIKVALELRIQQKEWKNAAVNASNLSELLLTIGDLKAALYYGRLSVEYADRKNAAFQMIVFRTTLADALFQVGRFEEAVDLFADAEVKQQERQTKFPYLFSIRGFRYNELLLNLGRYQEVLERAQFSLKISEGDNWLLDIALDHLSIGKAYAHLYQKEPTETNQQKAIYHLQEAVTGLQNAGYQDDIPRGLLARAAWYRQQEQYEAALEDLAETLDIADSSGMRLHLIDYHLESARLRRAMGQDKKAQEHIAVARQLIEETGYHRRDEELEALSGAAF